MYLKVTHGDGMGGDFLIEVKGPIHSGLASIPFDPKAQDHDIVGELGRELGRELLVPSPDGSIQPFTFNTVHVLEIDPAQTQFEANKGLLVVRYVWWDEPGDGIHAVVTTRKIFILSDKGDTIDKVR